MNESIIDMDLLYEQVDKWDRYMMSLTIIIYRMILVQIILLYLIQKDTIISILFF